MGSSLPIVTPHQIAMHILFRLYLIVSAVFVRSDWALIFPNAPRFGRYDLLLNCSGCVLRRPSCPLWSEQIFKTKFIGELTTVTVE